MRVLLSVYLLAFAVFFLDQVTKQIVRIRQLSTSGHFLDITFTSNTGSLFSLFDSAAGINTIFIIVSILALAILVVVVHKKYETALHLPFALIMGGILGNLLDRILFGAVLDWINIHFWPIFNIADSAIVCGVILAILLLLKKEFFERKVSS